MDLNEILMFVKVLRLGSFSAAAKQLGLPVSTVSTRVARLEQHLGVSLLRRTTRRLHATDAGQRLFEAMEPAIVQLEQTEALVKSNEQEPEGIFRLTAPADFDDRLMTEVVMACRRELPRVTLDITLTDRVVDLLAENIDVALRMGPLADNRMVARSVGYVQWHLYASPRYFDHCTPPLHPLDLTGHRCLQFTALGRENWTLWHGQETLCVPIQSGLVINDTRIVRRMAQEHDGIALLPNFMVGDAVADGSLVPVLPDWSARRDPVHLVWPQQRFQTPLFITCAELLTRICRSWFGYPSSP